MPIRAFLGLTQSMTSFVTPTTSGNLAVCGKFSRMM